MLAEEQEPGWVPGAAEVDNHDAVRPHPPAGYRRLPSATLTLDAHWESTTPGRKAWGSRRTRSASVPGPAAAPTPRPPPHPRPAAPPQPRCSFRIRHEHAVPEVAELPEQQRAGHGLLELQDQAEPAPCVAEVLLHPVAAEA